MVEINEAYRILGDEEKRRNYDKDGIVDDIDINISKSDIIAEIEEFIRKKKANGLSDKELEKCGLPPN